MDFEALDFLYTPSRDVAADTADFVKGLGAKVVFAIEDGGIRVAMLELTPGPPRILLTDHVDGDRPILVYRVADHRAAVADLKKRGWTPVALARDPAGTVQLVPVTGRPPDRRLRAIAARRSCAHFQGRRDF